MPPALKIFLSTVSWNNKARVASGPVGPGLQGWARGAVPQPQACRTGQAQEGSSGPDHWTSPQQPDSSKSKPRHEPRGWGQGRNRPWPGRSTAATSAGGAEHQRLS